LKEIDENSTTSEGGEKVALGKETKKRGFDEK
jgi:hypothetical protein